MTKKNTLKKSQVREDAQFFFGQDVCLNQPEHTSSRPQVMENFLKQKLTVVKACKIKAGLLFHNSVIKNSYKYVCKFDTMEHWIV